VVNAIAILPSAPVALATLDRLEAEIREASTFEKLRQAADFAAAIARGFKPVKEVADRAGEVWIAADDRLAEELAKIGPAKGTRGQIKRGPGRGHKKIGGAIIEPPISDAPTLAELGIDKKRAARAKRIRAIPKAKRRQLIERLKADGKGVTPSALLARQRQETKQEKKHEVLTAAFSAEGPFDVVVIDPPWPMQKIDRDERPNQDAFDYPVMTEEQLAAFWPKELADRLTPDCHVFCWTTQKFLPAAIRLMDAWKLRYLLTMVWHKTGGFQPHDLPQYNCEFVVYARQGAPVFTDTKDFPCCFTGDRREHSRKPDRFYEIVRRVTGGSRVDVFSREPREGFAQFGNEPTTIGSGQTAMFRRSSGSSGPCCSTEPRRNSTAPRQPI
jgi:N6-adenosine-specific RNA methylase IME4